MKKRRLDALIASTPDNVSYLCDIPNIPGVVSEADVHGIIFGEKSKEPALVMPAVACDQWAQSTSPIKEVRVYGEFYYYKNDPLNIGSLSEPEKRIVDTYFGQHRSRDIVAGVTSIFRDRDLMKGRVGFDEKNMPDSRIRRIRKKLPKIKFSPAYEVFQDIRMVKSADEIERIRGAVEATEKGIQAVMEAAKPGVKNKDLQFVFRTTVMKHDCTPFFAVIGAGTESAIVNHLPSEYVLRNGDIMRIDCNATCRNYVSDVGRNAVLGKPTKKAQKYFDALRKGTEAIEYAIRPGVHISELFNVAVATVQESGIPHYHRQNTGHSLGLHVVEPPIISSATSVRLQENMVIAIETPYYELGFGAFNPEDTVRVTKDGVEKLSKMENKLYSL
jgi:Xaa-Pro aminopeptidase